MIHEQEIMYRLKVAQRVIANRVGVPLEEVEVRLVKYPEDIYPSFRVFIHGIEQLEGFTSA